MSLRVWLPLNGDLHNQGLSNVNLTNTVTFATSGKIGASCLNSQLGWFAVPEMAGKKQMSFAYWVKLNTGTTTNWLDSFSWYSTNGTSDHRSRQEFYYYNSGGNTEAMTTGVWYYTSSNSGLTQRKIGQWYHYAFTIDYATGITQFFVDGVLWKTTTDADTSYYVKGNNFLLRESSLDCSINDFRLYDHILSELEVKEIARAKILHYPLNNNGISNLEIQEPTIEYDISGYCNNGIKTGTFTYSTNTPKYRLSTYINNGVNDYITTSTTIGNPADAITMNIWFKSSCTTPGSNYHEAFNHATSVQYFEFAIYKTGFFRQGITINGTRYVINGGSGLLDGNWHMLTATYDGTAIKRYIDGEIITDMTQLVTGTLNGANAKFLIGHYGSNTSYYAKEAYLSDARIYATALSAQDILSLYHNSALVDEQGIIHGAIH